MHHAIIKPLPRTGAPNMQTLPLRLVPGDDLRVVLEAIARERRLDAAFVLQGIGSLGVAAIRYAGVDHVSELHGDFEILTLAGSLCADGAHLHIAVSDARGAVLGGHVAEGCIVRTTAEVLVACLEGVRFSRETDARTGFGELCIRG
jgi:predicted DNA-binding protein with PD1-like motif